jgi:hypothetical protein
MYQRRNNIFVCKEYIEVMPPRRRRERSVFNESTEEEMRQLRARLDTMEIKKRRAPEAGYVSDVESENLEEEEVAEEQATWERLLRDVVKMGTRAKMEVSMYEGNFNVEELLDWISALDKYFHYEEIDDEKKVKHVVTRLKGHANLWWDELLDDKRRKGKTKIKSWEIMVAKLKDKFIPKDYTLNMFRRLQNLRHKCLLVKEYTEEFYKLNIRAGHRENDEEKVARYINGLRYEIQDDINMIMMRNVEDYYQVALKEEEKLARK